MSNVEQFEKAVTGAGAVALRIERKAPGEERLVIQTRGGLITRKVPLKGDLGKDIQDATAAARQIVASAKNLTAEEPAGNLSMSPGPRAAARHPSGYNLTLASDLGFPWILAHASLTDAQTYHSRRLGH